MSTQNAKRMTTWMGFRYMGVTPMANLDADGRGGDGGRYDVDEADPAQRKKSIDRCQSREAPASHPISPAMINWPLR